MALVDAVSVLEVADEEDEEEGGGVLSGFSFLGGGPGGFDGLAAGFFTGCLSISEQIMRIECSQKY